MKAVYIESHGGPEVYYAGIQQILEEEPDDNLWFFDAEKADVWWNRGKKAPLDLKTVGDRLEQRATKPYFRTN